MHPQTFVATTRPDAALPFYRDVLGLPLVATTPFALVFDNGGIPLRVQIAPPFQPLPFTVLGWTVDDIVAAVARLGANGVTFARFDGLEQDAQGIWTAPDGARVAWFRDPDGNVLSLSQA